MAVSKIIGKEQLNKLYNPTTQVFKATNRLIDTNEGKAWKSLPLMNRSFISFSYGGKCIEDFNLIAVVSGDRMQKNLYGNFEDDVTTYNVIDGQYHWGTHFTDNTFDFVLATDGITEAELNEFKFWFKPGYERELILAENPNRAIMARVAAVPSYSLLPFEHKIEIPIEYDTYLTSTTLYKGEISLSLVADEPFWYGLNSIIDYYYEDDKNKFGSMTHTKVENKETIKDKDFLKVIAEDNIPYIDSLQTEAILANNTYAILYGQGDNIGGSSIVGRTGNEDYSYAHVDNSEDPTNIRSGAPVAIEGMVGILLNSNLINSEQQKLNIAPNVNRYLYYSGTAPSKPIIKFSLTPQLQGNYIIYPSNNIVGDKKYNTLTIGTQTMKFTLPSLLLGYNQAIAIVEKVEEGTYIEELRQQLITGINEFYARAWAIKCLNSIEITGGDIKTITNNDKASFITKMQKFILAENGNCREVSFIFDSKKGTAIGQFNIPNDFEQQNTFTKTEQVGDMLRSNFIIINERNYPNKLNYIKDENCTLITTDYPGGLNNFSIIFKNMYY